MRVIVGFWFDSKMSVMDTDVYDSDLEFKEILKSAIWEREEFGYKPISIQENYVAFSDGCRLVLEEYTVIPNVYYPIQGVIEQEE